MSIAENLAQIRDRIARAASSAGRDPAAICLVAVSKTHPASAILDAATAGQLLFGENRVQEFAGKAPELGSLVGQASYRLIGHLQSNKAAKAAELFDAVDSVDSLKLARRLDEAAAKLGKTLDILLEVNIGGEEAKAGLAADSPELLRILVAAPTLANLRIRGLMTVPPIVEDVEAARPYFKKLRELRDSLRARQLPGVALEELSMGMSHDFEAAIAEGSTMVRVGTAIFGARDYSL